LILLKDLLEPCIRHQRQRD